LFGLAGTLVPVSGFVLAAAATVETASAEIPDVDRGEFRGMYKITASTDPIFPMTSNEEWFLDFGSGITAGKLSGSVAVSLRQNPNVKVRIMAWQYFPQQGSLIIGNQYAEGSDKAVAKGVWQFRSTSQGVIFERGTYQIMLERAKPGDY
jgi:hypothetical protein